MTKDFPCILTEMYFDSRISVKKLIKAIHNFHERAIWDKDVD